MDYNRNRQNGEGQREILGIDHEHQKLKSLEVAMKADKKLRAKRYGLESNDTIELMKRVSKLISGNERNVKYLGA